jgi:hypothetical protein
MSYTVPETEPDVLYVGDTWKWTKDLSDFPASTWTLTYNFISSDSGAANVTVTASADGDTHSVSVAKATTVGYAAGDYKWFSTVDDGTNRYQLSNGSTVVKPDPASDTDARSHVKKVLDAIESTIEGIASKEQQSYSIAGRSLSRYTPSELYDLKREYEALYQKELQEERISNGEGAGRTVKVRFTNA